MKYTILITALVLGLLAFINVASVSAEKQPPKVLQIGIKKKVADCPRKTKSGDTLTMEYTGILFNGDKPFDSSVGRAPFTFVLGAGQVIKGWDQGLLGMCVGEKRKLTIPPNLGYGDRGAGGAIPGGATLVFDVELLKIQKGDEVYESPKEDPEPVDQDQQDDVSPGKEEL